MEYFYHYTTLENWKKIQREGLQPYRNLLGWLTDLSDPARKPAIFGLHSSAPKNWVISTIETHGIPEPCPVLAFLLQAIKARSANVQTENLVLLKIRVLPEDDVYVADFEGMRRAYKDQNLEEIRKYAKSLTKVQSQFNIASKKLPEILCFNPIPADRIELIEKIPAKTFEEISAYVDAKKNKTGNALATVNGFSQRPNGSTC